MIRSPRTTLASFALVGVLAPRSAAQVCAPEPLPLSKAPVTGLDSHTALLGSFDSSTALLGRDGTVTTKVTMNVAAGGVFGTSALSIPSAPAVAIYPSDGFDPKRGSIEMWVKAAPVPGRVTLFSLRGAGSLDGDGAPDLIFGETTETGAPALSAMYFQGEGGSGIGAAAFTSIAPRGIGAGDLDGDGIADLAVASNASNLAPNPKTPLVPGEIHVWFGPFPNGSFLPAPARTLEVDRAQGLVVADFDQDGDLDLMAGSFDLGSEPLYGWTNDGAGNFVRMKTELGLGSTEAIAAGDVDLDGVLDVLFTSFDPAKPSRIALGRLAALGDYQIGGPSQVLHSLASPALGASLADLDADGWLDAVLALTGEGGGAVAIHRNDEGDFAATPTIMFPTTRPFTLNATRDVNHDGRLDIVVANWRDGLATTPTSAVYFGPFTGGGAASVRSFLVPDAVSFALGDLDADGADDLVFHSATSPLAPVFLLDWNGNPKAGVDGSGVALPSFAFPATTSKLNPNGEGAGMAIALGGTSSYGSVHVFPNSFTIARAQGKIEFSIVDDACNSHVVSIAQPTASASGNVNGFFRVLAEWDASLGLVELRVGPGDAPTIASESGAPFPMGKVAPTLRLGSDPENQQRASGWRIDDFRVSTVRRSALDFDADGIPDDWDNCGFLKNAAQQDADDDGVGDACAYCQDDLGFSGPGSLSLAVCGTMLTPGGSAAIRLRCGIPGTPFVLLLGPTAMPYAYGGGIVVPVPPATYQFGDLDDDGEFTQPFAALFPGVNVFAQALALDPLSPSGLTISNAVRIRFP